MHKTPFYDYMIFPKHETLVFLLRFSSPIRCYSYIRPHHRPHCKYY